MVETRLPACGVSLASVLPGARYVGASQIRATTCCGDSRQVRPGDLFVAQVGAHDDGHDFVTEAIARGAVAIVAEHPLPVRGVPVCLVDDSRDAYSRICQALAGSPAESLSLIGITGTSGKTSTTSLLSSVLRVAGGRPGSIGSFGYDDTTTHVEASCTTPPPPLFAQWLARMAANQCSHAVLEVSSEALAKRHLAGVTLDVACVTNITRAHLSLHNSLRSYRNTKARILHHLRPGGLTVLNADDPCCVRLLDCLPGGGVTFGLECPADVTATVIDRNPGDQTFLIHSGSDTAAVRTRIIGDPHVYNCLTAAAVGISLGIDLTTVARGLEQLDVIPGRMQRVDCGQGFGVFVDAASTPDALAKALGALRAVTPGRVLCVFGSEGGTDKEERQRMARAAEKLADEVVVTSDHSHDEPPQWIAAELVAAFDEPEFVQVILDRRAAIQTALDSAEEGDAVLIAGPGHAPYVLMSDPSGPNTDEAIVRQILHHALPWTAGLRVAA